MKNLFLLITAMSVGAMTMGASATQLPTMKSERARYSTLVNPKNFTTKQCGNLTLCTPIVKGKKADEPTVDVTLNYDCSSQYSPIGLAIYNNEAGMIHSDYDGTNKTVTKAVPKGTYDIYASYSSHYSELYYVFRENVVINGDTTITLPQAEAQTPFSIKTVDHNGNWLHMPIYNTSYQIVEDATAEDYSSLSFFILNGFGNVAAIIGGGYKVQDHEADFYVNQLSDRYKYCEARELSIGEVYWFNKYVISDFSTAQTITNDPTRFINYNQKFEVTPEWKDEAEFHIPGYYFAGVYNGDAIIGEQSYIPWLPSSDRTTKFYLDLPKDDDNSADQFNVLVKPLMGDYMTKESYFPGDTLKNYTFIRGQQVLGDKDGLYFINAGYEDNGGFNSPEGTVRSRFYPGHPAFSFKPNQVNNSVYGASCPINSLQYKTYTEGGQKYIDISPNYVGRYGELRDADWNVVDKTEQQVGQGVYSITLTNENVKVDGLDGKNETRMVIMQNAADNVPPTLQMLQFKDKDGHVTDQFSDPKDGVIELAAGDFDYNYVPEAYSGYFTCKPVNVQVSCYLHGTDEKGKKELMVEEDPNLYFMPGFGHFYRGSLENVPASVEKQWYDLKIYVIDNSQNNQVQIISPAFCINGSSSGIAITRLPTAQVTREGGLLVACGTENASMALYTIDGRQVATGNDSKVSIQGLAHGAYVVKVTEESGNCLTQKVLL